MSSTPLLPLVSTFPNSTLLWRTGALMTAVGMLTGAFGAHGLKKTNVPAESIQVWGTASQYAIMNGIALLLISMHPRFATHRFAGPAIAGGGFVFSSTIFALVLDKRRWGFLGPLTPMGGIAMIAGYVSLAL